jgi:hypothetical protein
MPNSRQDAEQERLGGKERLRPPLHEQETREDRLYLPASPLSVRRSGADLAEHRVRVPLNRQIA